MTKMMRFLTAAAAVLVMAALALPARAQLNPFTAPTSAMDELSGMGTGPSPGAYLPPAPGGSPFDPTSPPAAPASPYNQPYPANYAMVDPAFGMAEGGAPPGQTGVGYGPVGFGAPTPGFGAPQPPVPVIPTKTVLSGERYFDAFTRQLLEEAMVDEINELEVEGQYFDDGTHGDALANDDIYTNIMENFDFVGQLTHKLRKQNVSLLLTSEAIEPLEFFRLLAVTNDPLSNVPHEMKEEEARDERIRDWNNRFLAFARLNPADEKSNFHPLHVPRAPQMPDMPPPPGFDPRPPKHEEQQGGFGGGTPGAYAAEYFGGERGGGAGTPRGAASSRYF